MNMRNCPKVVYRLLLVCAFAIVAPVAMAGNDAAATVALVGTCVACHGADGIGKSPQYPNLQGQKAAYLEKQLKAFRSGERKDSNMNPLSTTLSDEDIAALAAYFENIN
jgi:cytochrome c553